MKTALLAIGLAGAFLQPVFAQLSISGPAYDSRPRISVSGEALVKVKPDQIIISLGVETSDPAIIEAKNKNTAAIKAAVTALKKLGITDDHLQTDYLSIEPRYRNNYEERSFIGHFVRNTLIVTINDPAQVENVVAAALEAGVNHIHGVDFQTTELRKYRDEARELALKAAKEKAVAMASALGQSVGEPLQISEHNSPWGYFSGWSSGWGYGRRDGMSQNVIQMAPSSSQEEGPLSLGRISIRANVQVTFELVSKAP